MERSRNISSNRSARRRARRDLSTFDAAFEAARERAGARVGELVGQVKHEGEEFLAGRKNLIAEQFTNVSGAIRRAADKLHDSDSALLADYVDRAADQLEDAGRYVEQSDLRAMMDDARALARERPLLFGGGLFLAGWAAARFLNAAVADGQQPRRGGRHRGSRAGRR